MKVAIVQVTETALSVIVVAQIVSASLLDKATQKLKWQRESF